MSRGTDLLDRPSPSEPTTSAGPLIGPATGPTLHVMSYNIRLHRPGTRPGHPDHWPDRAPLLRRLLQREQPTLLGVQEALHDQLPVVQQGLPAGYAAVGYGRAGGSKGEHSSIFYDARRLELLEWGQFWLSATPELIGSTTWGNTVPRIVTWSRFRDHGSGTELAHVNTHFDHRSETAREHSAGAVADLVRGFPPSTSTLVTGDFNASAGTSAAYTALTGRGALADTWETAERRLTPPWGTFPDYGDAVAGRERIDWVLASPDVRVLACGINASRVEGRHPSDHAPVQALVVPSRTCWATPRRVPS